MQMRGRGRAKAEAKSIAKEFRDIQTYMDDLEARQPQMRNLGLEALNVVSVLQLTRFAIKDIQDLASGKGGIGDILSLSTSLLLLQFRLNQLLQTNIALSGTLATVSAATGLGPLGLGIAAGVTIGGVIIGGLAWQQQQRMAQQAADRALREQIAQTLGLIQEQEVRAKTGITEQRKNLTDARSMGVK